METVEILAGGEFANAVKSLGLTSAVCAYHYQPQPTHWREEYQVWLLSKEDFDNICAIDNDDWKDDWGWWRHAYGSNLGAVDCAHVINGEKLMAWDGLQRKEWCQDCSDCAGTEKDKDECFHDHQYPDIQFCPNCYNGVVRFCPDCGKQIPRYRTLCDCDAVVQRRQQEENRKEKERLEKAEKHEPNALGSLFTMAQSDFYSHNEGYFSCWEDFFDSWNEDREEFTEKPLYVWGTEEVEMSFDASSIVSNACEDMYEDAYDDIGADAVAEMQRYLNEWKEKYGRTSYLLTTKHAIRIPWGEMK